MTDQAPLVVTLRQDADPVGAAADGTSVIGEAPVDGTVTRVAFIASSALTGANTESRTLTVKNKGQDGSGTTTVASKAFTSGVNAAASDATTVTLSGTPANLVVAQGDVLQLESTHVGSTGLADPGGEVVVEITRS